MGFVQPCFIRKNTKEIIEVLERLCYRGDSVLDNRCDCICIFERDCRREYLSFEYDDDFEVNIKDSMGFIDCGTNEELFFAIAALRDDSDYMQWFTDGNEFILCDRDYFVDMCSVLGANGRKQYELDLFHKASVDELINYFKI